MLFRVIQSLASGQSVNFWEVLAQIISVAFVVFCILPLHEFAHGWVAYKLGDPTAKNQGRLTMNPLASIDPKGALFLVLFGFGWAKPVPVDSRYFKKPKRDMAITALAGPVSNLLAALAGAILVVLIGLFAPPSAVSSFFFNMLYYYVVVNISLAVFNLIPVPPLDGSRIAAAFLSDQVLRVYYRYQNIFVLILFVLMMSGSLSGPLYAVQSFFARIVFAIAKFPFQMAGVL